MAANDRITKQIEQTAGLYGPITYASLLSFYDGFSPEGEFTGFIPLTAVVQRRDQDRILFAIGLIPPSGNPTGRPLDRSTSVASIGGEDGISESFSAGTGRPPSYATENPNSSLRERIVEEAKKVIGLTAGNNLAEFEDLVGGPNESEAMKNALATAKETSTCGLVAGGLWRRAGIKDPRLDPPYQVGSAISRLVAIALENGAYVEAKPGRFPQPGDLVIDDGDKPEGHVYTVIAANADTGDITSVDGGVKDFNGNQGADVRTRNWQETDPHILTELAGIVTEGTFDQKKKIIKDYPYAFGNTHTVTAWIDVSKLEKLVGGDPTLSSPSINGDAGQGDWQGKGSGKSHDASKEQSKLDGTPLNSTVVGKALQKAQQDQVKALQIAIEAMASAPPLKMLVNPQKFSVKGDKIIQDGSWGRNGPIIQHWGDGQDKISASGKLAGFYAIDSTNASGPGLTRTARNSSESWANFQSLCHLYRNNGGIYLPDPVNRKQTANLSLIGSMYIYYDNILYIGSFDNLNFTENDSGPFTMEYNFEFTVRAAFLLDRTDNQFTYGSPKLFPKATVPIQSKSFSTPE